MFYYNSFDAPLARTLADSGPTAESEATEATLTGTESVVNNRTRSRTGYETVMRIDNDLSLFRSPFY